MDGAVQMVDNLNQAKEGIVDVSATMEQMSARHGGDNRLADPYQRGC